MADEEQIIKIIGVLVLAYPKFEVKDETIEVYVQMLKDLEPAILDQAAKVCLTTCKWFPTIAELRSAASDIVARSTKLPSAGEAWGEVMDKVASYGHTLYASPKYPKPDPTFSHPMIDRAVKALGGWNAVCLSENPVADRARFLQIYESLENRARTDMQFLPETHEQIDRLAAVNQGVQALVKKFSIGDGKK